MASPRGLKRALAADLILSGLVAAGAAVLLYGAASLPPPRFDPLGSAALPRALAVLMLIFSAVIAVGAVRRRTRSEDEDQDAPDKDAAPAAASPVRGLLIFGALVTYVAALDFARAPFVPATTLMMAVSGLVLHRANWRTGLLFGVFGLGLGLGLSYVFTHFLYVDFG